MSDPTRQGGGGSSKADEHGRVKRNLFMQLGAGIGLGTSASSLAAPAKARARGGVVSITKLSLAALVGAVLATGVILLYLSNGKSRLPAISTPIVDPARIDVPFPTLNGDVAPGPAATGSIAAPELAPRPAAFAQGPSASLVRASTSAARREVAATASAAPPEVPQAPSQGSGTAAAEAELLRQANAARRAGDPSGALALLEEHRSRFANGTLVQEREAERVIVLCALGRPDDARAAGYVFLRDWPRSPLADRVQDSCGGRLDARH
jgi:hypothetical protein